MMYPEPPMAPEPERRYFASDEAYLAARNAYSLQKRARAERRKTHTAINLVFAGSASAMALWFLCFVAYQTMGWQGIAWLGGAALVFAATVYQVRRWL